MFGWPGILRDLLLWSLMMPGTRRIRCVAWTGERSAVDACELSCQPERVAVDSAVVVAAAAEVVDHLGARAAAEHSIRMTGVTSAAVEATTLATAPGPAGAKAVGGLVAVALGRVHASSVLAPRPTAAAVAVSVIAIASVIVTVVLGPGHRKSPAGTIVL